MIGLTHYLILSSVLFAIGALGVLLRRNLIAMLLSVEIMLNAANLSFVAASRAYGDLGGQVMALLVIAIAAAEVAVGLAILVQLYRQRETLDPDDLRLMKG